MEKLDSLVTRTETKRLPSVPVFYKPLLDKYRDTLWPMVILPSPYKEVEHAKPEAEAILRCMEQLIAEKNSDSAANSCVVYDPAAKVFGPVVRSEPAKTLGHCVMNMTQKYKAESEDDCYNLKGLYVIVKKEPCVMCAMALVHARVERLYFCIEREKDGGILEHELYSKSPPLNHKYHVFRIAKK